MASPQKAQTLAERLTFIAKVFEAKESSLAKEFHALSEEAGELEREKTDWFMQADTLNEQLEAAESRVAALTEVLSAVVASGLMRAIERLADAQVVDQEEMDVLRAIWKRAAALAERKP